MDSTPCLSCGGFFKPRNKLQNYCSAPACQKARKADWQRNKLRSDPEYYEGQKLSQKKWQQASPGYWRSYREAHPDQAERNRVLQRLRNRHRHGSAVQEKRYSGAIAKMDAKKSCEFDLVGAFWIIPVIAKMDAAKVYFRSVSSGSS